MQTDWSPLTQELKKWRASRLDLPFWWRDDDAISRTPALSQLADLSDRLAMPLHLAIIPKGADQSLVEFCRSKPQIVPLVHGWTHTNHAPQDEKKAEFGHQRERLHEDARKALVRMSLLFGAGATPVFVPPWNRVSADLIPMLRQIGYTALSTFTPRATPFAAPGLLQINTHIDPIHWRGGGGLVNAEALIHQICGNLTDRRENRTDNTEPLGLLTHHLVHDQAIWNFTEACIARLLDGGARAVNLRDEEGLLP